MWTVYFKILTTCTFLLFCLSSCTNTGKGIAGYNPYNDALKVYDNKEYKKAFFTFEELAKRGMEGYVTLELSIDANGEPKNIKIVESSNSIFNKSALKAISSSKFKPVIINGQVDESLRLTHYI